MEASVATLLSKWFFVLVMQNLLFLYGNSPFIWRYMYAAAFCGNFDLQNKMLSSMELVLEDRF